MKKIILLTIACLFLLSHSLYAENVYSLIKEGKIVEAKDSLSNRTSALNRNGNDLYFLSMLEESADKSAQLMNAALRASVSPAYQQEIYYRLAQYYFIKEDYRLLQNTINEYMQKWENGKFRADMFRYRIFFEENKKNFNSAIKEIDRYLLEYTDGNRQQYGLIDKARIMHRYNKKIAANKLLRKLSRKKSGPGVPMALYKLASVAIKSKNTDDAVFFYNIQREGYPSSVGLDATIDKMTGMATSGDNDSRAEQLTDTFYSVQVGVFSSNGNAKKFSKSFKTYNKKIDLKSKKISDKKYYVVFVGHFKTYNSAYTFKETLESKHNEVFQVIAR